MTIMGPGASIESVHATLIAAADNGYGSRIPLNASFVTVASVATNANDWVTLPVGVKPGHTVRAWSTPAHELRTAASTNLKINNVDSDGTQEAAIPATTLWVATYINATIGWVLELTSELGATVTAVVPD